MNEKRLNEVAVERKTLSTNIGDILYDCNGLTGSHLASVLQNNFPLAMWLLNTSMSSTMRTKVQSGFNVLHRGTEKWELEVPGSVYSELFKTTSSDCCWVAPDFAKCSGTVPVNLLCLKDCDTVEDELVGNILKASDRDIVPDLVAQGQTLSTIKKNIARLSFAFLTAYTAVLGVSDSATDILKPFHGLLDVLENPAVMHFSGTSLLPAFDQLGCRLDVLNGSGNYVIAVHPLIMNAIDAAVQPGQFGTLPTGWARENGTLTFHGVGFIVDKMVPVDIANATGEAWLLDSESVGLFLATNLLVGDDFIRYSGLDDSANCGQECTYYYNLGATFGNDANRLAVVTDIPFNSACASAVGDLGNIIQPKTLVPSALSK